MPAEGGCRRRGGEVGLIWMEPAKLVLDFGKFLLFLFVFA